jgi:DNA gyrase/topoisomerase IV subunit A
VHAVAWTSTGPDLRHLSRAHLVIESLPPGVNPAEVCRELADHRRPGSRAVTRSGHRHDLTVPIGDLADLTSDAVPVRIAITLRPPGH